MLTPVKVLVFITLILPIIITSFILSLYNFGVIKFEGGNWAAASKYSSLIFVQSSKSNPFITDEKAGPIINGIWYILTLIASLFVSWSLFSSS